MPRGHGGPWAIDGRTGHFTCFGAVTHAAWQLSVRRFRQYKAQGMGNGEARKKAAVRVRYKGRRRSGKHADRSDFLMYPGRRRDHSIDPTNQKKAP
jgi:uncharacterized protein YoaH (UPF0181 family)